MNAWDEVLSRVHSAVDTEDFRRWFAPTLYASDIGSQVTVWVPSEAIRRYLTSHFQIQIDRALEAIGRAGTQVRFVVVDLGDDEEEPD